MHTCARDLRTLCAGYKGRSSVKFVPGGLFSSARNCLESALTRREPNRLLEAGLKSGGSSGAARFPRIMKAGREPTACLLVRAAAAREAVKLLLIQIVFFQEFRPEILWRSGNVWPTLRRKVHEIPIRPHGVDMIRRQFSSPEMENLSALLPKHMHHWPLHIIRVSLAFVIGLIGRVRSGNQRNLGPSTLFGPRIDSIGRGFGYCSLI